jgi:hypothetical protein
MVAGKVFIFLEYSFLVGAGVAQYSNGLRDGRRGGGGVDSRLGKICLSKHSRLALGSTHPPMQRRLSGLFSRIYRPENEADYTI